MDDAGDTAADAAGQSTPANCMRVAILTAFTSDYTIGHLCAPYNRRYAERHGYVFVCRVHPPAVRGDERHPTWHKVALLNEALRCVLHPSDEPPAVPHDTTHLLWVDADAVVLRQDMRLEELWAASSGGNECVQLLIGEDVTCTCLVNAGVLGVRVSAWSAALWGDVWAAESSRVRCARTAARRADGHTPVLCAARATHAAARRACTRAQKYYKRRYHEQTCLLRQLARRGEGLGLESAPIHAKTPLLSKRLYPHVCVLPRRAFNTNVRVRASSNAMPPRACDLCRRLTPCRQPTSVTCIVSCIVFAAWPRPRRSPRRRYGWPTRQRCDVRAAPTASVRTASVRRALEGPTALGVSPAEERRLHEFSCEFIFHAAGHPVLLRGDMEVSEVWKPPKHVALAAVLAHAGLSAPADGDAGSVQPGGGLDVVDDEGDAATAVGPADVTMRPPPRYQLRYPGRVMN
jgi:hypothetical protein